MIRRVTVAEDCLAELAGETDAWTREDAREALDAAEGLPGAVRDAHLLRVGIRPIMLIVLKLSAGPMPGAAFDEDVEWAVAVAAARREVLGSQQKKGFADGLCDRNLRLVDRISSLIGCWPEPDWSAAVRSAVQGHVDACRAGGRRGQGLWASAQADPPRLSTVGWLLRHPADHHFRCARDAVRDPWLRAHLAEWIAALAPSDAALAEHDRSTEPDAAELVLELTISDPVPRDRNQPAPATRAGKPWGDMSLGTDLLIRQVADPNATFNGKLLSVLAGARWLVYGSVLRDGSVLAHDGTRRLEG